MTREQVLARLILSTKRQKRLYDLVQIENDIRWLLNSGENKNSIAQMLGISTGMLNQFLAVGSLNKELQQIVKDRIIDSVTLVHVLSKFSSIEQIVISNALEAQKISASDIRLIQPLKKQLPDVSINELITRIVESKNKKVSVIKFAKSSLNIPETLFINRVKNLIQDDFVSLNNDNEIYSLRISKNGEKKLRLAAKNDRLTLNELFNTLLN